MIKRFLATHSEAECGTGEDRVDSISGVFWLKSIAYSTETLLSQVTASETVKRNAPACLKTAFPPMTYAADPTSI